MPEDLDPLWGPKHQESTLGGKGGLAVENGFFIGRWVWSLGRLYESNRNNSCRMSNTSNMLEIIGMKESCLGSKFCLVS